MFALLASVCGAQVTGLSRNVLTNRDVVTLANASFSEEFILQTIATSRAKFDVSADGLADLAKHGISESIIWSMRQARPVATGCCGLDDKETGAPEAAEDAPERPVRVFVEGSPASRSVSAPNVDTVEMMRAFGQGCPSLMVTSRRAEASFTVALEHRPGRFLRRKRDSMIVFDRSGDLIYAASMRAPGKAVRGFCAAVPVRAAAKAPVRQAEGRFPGRPVR